MNDFPKKSLPKENLCDMCGGPLRVMRTERSRTPKHLPPDQRPMRNVYDRKHTWRVKDYRTGSLLIFFFCSDECLMAWERDEHLSESGMPPCEALRESDDYTGATFLDILYQDPRLK